MDIKLLFSSMTRRCCPYVYTHVTPDPSIFLMTNSIAKTDDGIEDALTLYNVADLTIHYIQVLDTKLVDEIYSHFTLNTMYYFHTAEYLQGKYNPHPLTDAHVLYSLRQLMGTLEHLGISDDINYFVDAIPCTKATPLVYNYTLPVYRYTGKDVDRERTFNLPLVDGLTTVSWREFIPKVSKEPYTHKLYTWLADGSHIEVLSMFRNNHLVVKSFKPNLFIMSYI